MRIEGQMFILLIMLIMFTDCKMSEVEMNFEEDINNYKSYVSPEPFEYFSSDIYNEENFLMVMNPSGLYAKGYCGIFFKHNYKNHEFDSIVLKLRNESIFESALGDSKNYFVPNFKENRPLEKFPVPFFNDPLFSFKDSIEVEQSRVFGFRNIKGDFFTQKGINDIQDFSKVNKLDSLSQGYSNGVIIDFSSNMIIYWIIVW
jgi:hypothetical protein